MYWRGCLQHFPKHSCCFAHDGVINRAHLSIAKHWLDPLNPLSEQVNFALASFIFPKNAVRILKTFSQAFTFPYTQVPNFLIFSRFKNFALWDMEYWWYKNLHNSPLSNLQSLLGLWQSSCNPLFFVFSLEEKSSVF